MIPIPGKKFRTCHMEPMPNAGHPHAGLINVEYVCPNKERSDVLLDFFQLMVTGFYRFDQCPRTDGMPEQV